MNFVAIKQEIKEEVLDESYSDPYPADDKSLLPIKKLDVNEIKLEASSEDQTNVKDEEHDLYFDCGGTSKTASSELLAIHGDSLPYKSSLTYIKSHNQEQKSVPTRHKEDQSDAKQYKCWLCKYISCNRNAFSYHMLTHQGPPAYSCSLCTYRTYTESRLTRHLTIHSNNKSFKCSVCDYCCLKKAYMERHLATHSNERPYECFHCNYKAKQKVHLAEHVKKHLNKRAYKCPLCSYSAAYQRSVTIHMKVHTEKNLFT